MKHKLCRCGRMATHRMYWNPWLEIVEPLESRPYPSRCLRCAKEDAPLMTERWLQKLEWARSFDPLTRVSYRTDVPLPHDWHVKLRAAVRRHQDYINPRGLVEMERHEGYAYLDIYPPTEGKPDTWNPANCLYLLRYLTMLPLVFVPIARDESPSTHTWRESRKQWLATLTVPLLSPPTTPEGSLDGRLQAATAYLRRPPTRRSRNKGKARVRRSSWSPKSGRQTAARGSSRKPSKP